MHFFENHFIQEWFLQEQHLYSKYLRTQAAPFFLSDEASHAKCGFDGYAYSGAYQ